MNKTSSATRCRHESEDNDWSHWLSSSLDSESATKARTKQALLYACSRHESKVNDWSRYRACHSKWACYNDIKTWFSNESSFIHIFYDWYLFTTLTTTAKMICTADRIERILYVSRKRIEHILYVWNHKNMSWNSFIIEYLKLNRKSLLEWQE